MGDRRVLVVEDDKSVGRLIVNLLAARGISADLVTDGLEALESLATATPDLVVLDLALPKVDGWEILNTLQEAGRTVPVIVVTAHGRGEGATRARGLGVRRFFEKPFVPSQLAAAIKDVLEESPQG